MSTPGQTEYDLLVVGAGSGGIRAARRAAELGASVLIVEEAELGGTCVNLGCVPKKLFCYSADYHSLLEDAAAYGWQIGKPDFNWTRLVTGKNREIARLNSIYRQLLEDRKIVQLHGTAAFRSNRTVVVNGQDYRAQHILIATGSRHRTADFSGGELTLSSDDMFHLQKLPEHLAIIGGGYIAVEFAGIMHRLGVKVSLCYRGELFLRGFDRQLRAFLRDQMLAAGMNLRFNFAPAALEQDGQLLKLHSRDGETVNCDAVLYAAGRIPNTDSLELSNTDVKIDPKGRILVDANWRTAAENIYAIGDVIGPPELTPVAIAQGDALARRLFSTERLAGFSLQHTPSAVFGWPMLASVGLSEEQARAVEADVKVYSAEFRPMRNTIPGRQSRCLIKLVAQPGADGRVLGAHMVGSEAPEIIQALAVALNAGATIDTFRSTLALHPTTAEEFVLL